MTPNPFPDDARFHVETERAGFIRREVVRIVPGSATINPDTGRWTASAVCADMPDWLFERPA